jgi:hypothetical protein
MNCLLLAMAPANTTAVAAKGIDEGYFASRHKADGSKLAGRKASSAATAAILQGLGHILSSKKKVKAVAISEQSQAIGPITVAEAPNKGGFKGPEGMYQGLLFITPQQCQCFIFVDIFEELHIRPWAKGLKESFFYVQQLFRIKAKTKTVAGVIISGAVFPADAGQSDNRARQSQNLFQLSQGHHLTKMVSTVTSLIKPVAELPQP